ncbi:inositol monophosphatase [Candidatus Woesearchaeota archaeon]|nr:inositol monophosphatase [Candidatus Woesearchaeota archaeon]
MTDFLSEAEAVAIKAVREAGEIALKHFRKKLSIEFKASNVRNLVTNADKEADAVIRKIILARFPDHSIVTEEAKPQKGNDYVWYVDPIDGTTNYSKGANYFTTSVALTQGNRLLIGVIYNPVFPELYTAISGRGAFMNGKRIRTTKAGSMGESIVCCDFGYEDWKRERILKVMAQLLQANGLRFKGSGTLEMCEVAAGISEAYLNLGSSPWDYSAATLIVREAGGVVTDYDGKHWTLSSKSIVASCTQELHSKLLEKIATAAKKEIGA